jgi:hypothetical protein
MYALNNSYLFISSALTYMKLRLKFRTSYNYVLNYTKETRELGYNLFSSYVIADIKLICENSYTQYHKEFLNIR